MADIKIIVDSGDVVTAAKKTKTLEGNIKLLSNAFKGNSLSSRNYYKGIKQLADATGRSESELRKYANQLRANAKITDAAALAEKQRLRVLREEKIALDQKNKAEMANTAELKRFRISTDAVYAAEQKLLRLKKMLRAEVEAGNMTMRQAAAVQMQYKQSLTTMGGGLQQTKNKMSSMGVVTQQAGYQLGDFIVQVQGGQSAFIAFSQQATQMVGFLPLMAARLGITTAAAVGLSAALGIGIPIISSLAMVLFAVSKSAKEAEESANRFESSLKSAKEEALSLTDAIRMLQQGLSNPAQLTLGDQVEKAEADIKDAKAAVESLLADVIEMNENLVGGLSEAEIRAVALDLNLDPSNAIAIALAAWDAADAELANLNFQIKHKDLLQGRLKANKDFNQLLIDRGITQQNNYRTAREDIATMQQANDLKAIGLSYGKDSLEYLNEQHKVERLLLEKRIEEERLSDGLADNLRQALVAGQLFELVDFSNLDRAASAADRLRIAMTKVGGGKKEVIFDPRDPRYDPIAAAVASMEHGTYDPDKDKPKTDTKTGDGKSPQEQLAEFLAKKKEEADLQSQLVGLFGEERDLKSELIKFEQEYGDVAEARQTAEYTATLQQIAADKERQKVLEEARQQQEAIADTIATSMGNALMSMVDGTMSVKDAFKSMASAIIKDLYRILVVEKMVQSIKGYLNPASAVASAVIPSANGNVFSGGSLQAYANGGVVGGPTTFPMAGGKTGLMGEAGPEAIMPLKRGANGKLGVQMEGGGGDTINVVQNFSFQANGDATIKQLIAQAAPKIAQMTKSSLLDDRRRGGSTKAAFG